EVIARNHATDEPICVEWRNGIIVSIRPSAPSEIRTWVAPALVDLQVNGFAGVDFQQDNLTGEALGAAARGLAQAGCGRWLLTLVTDDWERLLRRLSHLRSLRGRSPELQHAIAGWHIEGPFLSAQPGFCGAHDPQWMRDPTPQAIDALRDATDGDPLLLTLAP